MRTVKIGLLGAVIDDENNGCIALTYSLINLLEEIAKELRVNFSYIIFQERNSFDAIKKVEEKLGVIPGHIKIANPSYLWTIKRALHYPLRAINTLKYLNRCDVLIDLTAGDSFTDIYGQGRFDSLTNIKMLILKMNKVLILGPQTYGPFLHKKNYRKAIKVIDKAALIIARDFASSEYLKNDTKKNIYTTTDLAFNLPYKQIAGGKSERIKIGINISGLLVKNKKESTTLSTKLTTDYDEFIVNLVDYLVASKKYEIYVIPHVGYDGGDIIRQRFPNINYVSFFDNPISAKNFISSMDIFVGARMHATIAALSSGVATIPTSYSRKFGGLFEALNYNYTVDMTKLDTSEALRKTLLYIQNYEELTRKAIESGRIAKLKNDETKCLIKNEIGGLL